MKYFGTIYRIINTLDGRMYIGQTIDLKTRKRKHFGPHKLKTHLYNAMRKYGKRHFIMEEICTCITSYEDLNFLESYFIDVFNTYGDAGYNETLGGEGTRGKKHTEKTKAKMKLARKGRTPSKGMKHSEETKFKMAQDRTKEKHSMWGKKQTHESKEQNKMSQPTRKPVICIETGQYFNSISEAGRFLNIDPSHIQGVLTGKYKKAKGNTFKEIV